VVARKRERESFFFSSGLPFLRSCPAASIRSSISPPPSSPRRRCEVETPSNLFVWPTSPPCQCKAHGLARGHLSLIPSFLFAGSLSFILPRPLVFFCLGRFRLFNHFQVVLYRTQCGCPQSCPDFFRSLSPVLYFRPFVLRASWATCLIFKLVLNFDVAPLFSVAGLRYLLFLMTPFRPPKPNYDLFSFDPYRPSLVFIPHGIP